MPGARFLENLAKSYFGAPLEGGRLLQQGILNSPRRSFLFTARKRSLGQGNMFTGMCLSTGGVPGLGGLVPGGACLGGAWWRPPRQPLLRAVRILLECILVTKSVQLVLTHLCLKYSI